MTPGDLGAELASFVRDCRAENLSHNTTYAGAVVSLAQFLIEHDDPTDVRAITRDHVEGWQTGLLHGGVYKPAKAHQRFRGAQRFFAWYASVDDDETFRSPMAKLKPPRLPEYLPEVLTLP